MLQTVWERHCESPRALEMVSQEFGRALNAGGDSAVMTGQASAAPKGSSKGGAKPQLGEPQSSLLSVTSLASMQNVSFPGYALLCWRGIIHVAALKGQASAAGKSASRLGARHRCRSFRAPLCQPVACQSHTSHAGLHRVYLCRFPAAVGALQATSS